MRSFDKFNRENKLLAYLRSIQLTSGVYRLTGTFFCGHALCMHIDTTPVILHEFVWRLCNALMSCGIRVSVI